MFPILWQWGPVKLYTYGVALGAALLISTWLASHRVRQLPPELRAISPAQCADFACLSLLGGLLAGRLFYVILQWEAFRQFPQEIPAIWHGGLVWYGGFAGGLLAAWLYTRAKRLAFLRVIDHWIPFLTLGHAIGRVGCFLNGCCYGLPTPAWFGVTFPGQEAAVIPAQLFEAAGLTVLYVFLRRLQRPALPGRPGTLFSLYLIGYASLRFFMEFLRGDQATWWAGLTLQQLISVAAFLSGWALLWRVRRHS